MIRALGIRAALALALFILAASGPVVAGTDEGDDTEGGGHFVGPHSVGAQLQDDADTKKPLLGLEIERWFQPYVDFKKKLNDDQGLGFGLDYTALVQAATASLGEDLAASGVFRFYAKWELLGRGSRNNGSFVFKVENRHRLGAEIPPKELGGEVGSVGSTAVEFNDPDWILTNFLWNQTLADGRVAFVFGMEDPLDYVDTYSLVNPFTDFTNMAFSTNPTIPIPEQAMAAAVSGMFTDQIYALGGILDRNGDAHDPVGSVESFFSDAEFLTHLEIGWVPSLAQRDESNMHLIAWYADSQETESVASGWGVAASWNRLMADKWEPFVRAGFAEGGGALWDASISVGVGYHIDNRDDLLGVGLNWGRPSEDLFGDGLDDQYTAEIYYRLHLLPHLTVTPDVQILVDPAFNPDENVIAVFGLRARLDF